VESRAVIEEEKLDARSKAQTEVWVTYGGYIGARFCFLFMIRTMNPPQRTVSALVLAVFAAAAVYAILSGFAKRLAAGRGDCEC
jgi:hypothetical protein